MPTLLLYQCVEYSFHFQVDFLVNATVASILTQGRDNYSHWVETYQMSYSNNGISFRDYKQGGITKVSPKVIAFDIMFCLFWSWLCHVCLAFLYPCTTGIPRLGYLLSFVLPLSPCFPLHK